IHVLEDAEAVEDAGGLGREVLATDLGAWELRLVEEEHRPAALGEEDGGGAPRRARADHDGVVGRHAFTLTAHRRSRGTYRRTSTRARPARAQSPRTSS